jgi:hypothetical protein
MVKWSSLLLGALWIVGTSTIASAQGHAPEPGYQDDRSTAESVIGSYFDAVNRREYARAYSYWEPAAAASQLAPFDDFAAGYADTAAVDLTLGDIGSGVGAGQLYFTVPVTLIATMSDGAVQTFVGCYTLHIGRPQIQAVPPFQPLAIQRASIRQVDNEADTAGLMSQSCPAV